MQNDYVQDAAGIYFLSSVMIIISGFAGSFAIYMGYGNITVYEVNIFAMAIFMLMPVMALARANPDLARKFSPAGLSRSRPAIMPLAVCASVFAAFAMTNVGNVVYTSLEAVGYTPAESTLIPTDWRELTTFVISSVFVAAACEEAVLRGAILTAFEPGGSWRAIVVSAALFAILHCRVESLVQSFLAGIMLGFATVATGSVMTSIVMHATYNATIIGMSFMSVDWQLALFGAGIAHDVAASAMLMMIVAAILAGIRHLSGMEFTPGGGNTSMSANAIILLSAGIATALCVMAVNAVQGIAK